jgi:hypothetical protein
MRVSRFSRWLSLVRRMSAGENREKTSSVDSGSSQNYHERISEVCRMHVDLTYTCPVGIVCANALLL